MHLPGVKLITAVIPQFLIFNIYIPSCENKKIISFLQVFSIKFTRIYIYISVLFCYFAYGIFTLYILSSNKFFFVLV